MDVPVVIPCFESKRLDMPARATVRVWVRVRVRVVVRVRVGVRVGLQRYGVGVGLG